MIKDEPQRTQRENTGREHRGKREEDFGKKNEPQRAQREEYRMDSFMGMTEGGGNDKIQMKNVKIKMEKTRRWRDNARIRGARTMCLLNRRERKMLGKSVFVTTPTHSSKN